MRHLVRTQHLSRITQIAKQQGKAEATVVAAFPKNDVKVLTAQCPIPDDLAFVAGRRKQPCPLLIGRKLSSRHCVLTFTSDGGHGIWIRREFKTHSLLPL